MKLLKEVSIEMLFLIKCMIKELEEGKDPFLTIIMLLDTILSRIRLSIILRILTYLGKFRIKGKTVHLIMKGLNLTLILMMIDSRHFLIDTQYFYVLNKNVQKIKKVSWKFGKIDVHLRLYFLWWISEWKDHIKSKSS